MSLDSSPVLCFLKQVGKVSMFSSYWQSGHWMSLAKETPKHTGTPLQFSFPLLTQDCAPSLAVLIYCESKRQKANFRLGCSHIETFEHRDTWTGSFIQKYVWLCAKGTRSFSTDWIRGAKWLREKDSMKNKVKNTKSKTKQVNNHEPSTAVRRRTWKSKVFPNKSRAFILRAEVLRFKQLPCVGSCPCPPTVP